MAAMLSREHHVEADCNRAGEWRVHRACSAPPVGVQNGVTLCPGRKAGAVAVSSVSRWSAAARRVSGVFRRYEGRSIAPVPRVPKREARAGSSNRIRDFSIPGPGPSAHGGETPLRSGDTISRPQGAAVRCGVSRRERTAPDRDARSPRSPPPARAPEPVCGGELRPPGTHSGFPAPR